MDSWRKVEPQTNAESVWCLSPKPCIEESKFGVEIISLRILFNVLPPPPFRSNHLCLKYQWHSYSLE